MVDERVARISPELLLKLASCVVHCSDYLSEGGDERDLAAALQLWTDPEMVAWLKGVRKSGLLPLKSDRTRPGDNVSQKHST